MYTNKPYFYIILQYYNYYCACPHNFINRIILAISCMEILNITIYYVSNLCLILIIDSIYVSLHSVTILLICDLCTIKCYHDSYYYNIT